MNIHTNHSNTKIDITKAYTKHIWNIIDDNPEYHPYLVTKSFKNRFSKSTNLTPLKLLVEDIWNDNDRIYRHIVSFIVPNFMRTQKRYLYPLAFNFFDLPGSKQSFVNLIEPGLPHLHCVYLVHGKTLNRFHALIHEQFHSIVQHRNKQTQRLTFPSLVSVHAEPIADQQDIPRVVSYAGKLLTLPSVQALATEIDFYNQSPKPLSV